jgi:hypothetical protein
MDLFDFYSREFKSGELVAVFKTAKKLLGYGLLISQVAHTDTHAGSQPANTLLSDWSGSLGNSTWMTYVNYELIIVNEFDMEKIQCQ